MASSFLQKKAAERNQVMNERYGAAGTGGSVSLNTGTPAPQAPEVSVTAPKKASNFLVNKAAERSTTPVFKPANTVKPSTSSAADLQKKLEAAKKERSEAMKAAASASIYSSDYLDKQKAYKEKQDAYAAIEKQIKAQEVVKEAGEKTYKDNFRGQFAASYTVGDLSERSNQAWNEYLKNPTSENRAYAEALDNAIEQFQENNVAALDEDAKARWISQTLAGYLPQFLRQTGASVAGAAGGAVLGSAVPVVGTVAGAKAGAVAGTGAYSLANMRGAAFKALLASGVNEEAARKAANDEAVISSLIEMADTGLDIATLGNFSALKAVVSKGLTKWAGEASLKKASLALAKYGINILGEMGEEGTQEAVSIANQQRVASGDSDKSLVSGAVDVLKNAVTGKDEESAAQIWAAAKEGGKIAAMMAGANVAIQQTAQAGTKLNVEKVGAKVRTMYGEDQLIEKSLENFGEDTETYRMAKAMQEREDANFSDFEMGELVLQMRKDYKSKRTTETQQRDADLVEMAQSENAEDAQYATAQLAHPEETVVSPVAQTLIDTGMKAALATEQAELIRKITAGNLSRKDIDAAVKTLRLDIPEVRAAFTEATGTNPLSSADVNTNQKKRGVIRSAAEVIKQRAEREAAVKAQEQAQAQEKAQVEQNYAAEIEAMVDIINQSRAAETDSQAGPVDAADLEAMKTPMTFDSGTLTFQEFVEQYTNKHEGATVEEAMQAALPVLRHANQSNTAYPGTVDDYIAKRGAQERRNSVGELKTETAQQNAEPGKMTVAQDLTLKRLNNLASQFGVSVKYEDLGTKENGRYDADTKTITVNSRKATTQFGITYVFVHEITHRAQDTVGKSLTPDLLSVAREMYGSENVDAEVQKRLDLYRNHYESIGKDSATFTREMAEDEFAADFMMEAIRDRALLDRLSGIKPSIPQRFIQFIKNYLKSAPKGQKQANKELNKLVDRMRESMLRAAGDQNTSVTEGQETVTNDAGELVMDRDGGEVLLSLSTYENTGRDKLAAYLARAVAAGDLSQRDADDIWSGIEWVYGIAKDLKPGNKHFAEWSDAEVRLDKDGKPAGRVRVNNGDYEQNFDYSTVCKKRQPLDAVLNMLLRDDMLNLNFSDQQTIVRINNIIKSHGFEIACAMCFVDAKRFRIGTYAKTFRNKWNPLVKSLVPKGSDLTANQLSISGEQASANSISRVSDAQLDWTQVDKILATVVPGKPLNMMQKMATTLKEDPSSRVVLDESMLMSSESMDLLRAEYPNLYGLANQHQGAGKPKIAHDAVQWMNEIIDDPSFTPEKAFAIGGVRMQSFSDFVVTLFFDYVEMFAEIAAKKLPVQAYTKEAAFVELFGLTGAKINMSLIPAVNTYDPATATESAAAFRKHAGLDENGNYIWADESFDYATALDLQARDGYKDNIGTVCVGISDAHIRKLLADKFMHYVIPYHKSGLNVKVAEANNIHWFTDYTKEQSEIHASGENKGKKLTKSEAKALPSFYECLEQTGDPRWAAEMFVRACEDADVLPRFSQRANGEWLFCYKLDENGQPVIGEDGRKVVDENYYKLLADFSLYDNEGNYTPQQAVEMRMPENTKAILERYLPEYEETLDRRDAELESIVAEIKETLGNKKPASKRGERYSLSGSNPDLLYMDWADQVDLTLAGRTNDLMRAGYDLEGNSRDSVLHVMMEPTAMLQDIGFSDLPLVITQKHLQNVVAQRWESADSNKIKNKDAHEIPVDVVKRLPELIQNPVAIFKSDPSKNESKGGVVIMTDLLDSHRNPICVTIGADRTSYVYDGTDGPAHFVNIYGRENFDNFLEKAFETNGVIYLNKQKTDTVPWGAQVNRHQSSAHGVGFDTIIQEKDTTVKRRERRFSLSDDVSAHKEAQLRIVQKNNPMHDDIHTGIRSVNDILTFEEALAEDDSFTPDFNEAAADAAVRTGSVTVYSSYPITPGVFVTPSRMIAKDYAGSGRVYDKQVHLDEVAWVDISEGQYAPVEGKNVRFSVENENDTDTIGWELTEEQQEFFKDSKARDTEGRLLHLFHGTTLPGISVFKTQPHGSSSIVGMFLTDQRSVAELFSRTANPKAKVKDRTGWNHDLYYNTNRSIYHLYANVKNPMVIDAAVEQTNDAGEKSVVPSMWDLIPTPQEMRDAGFQIETVTTNGITAFAYEHGYDGVIIRNVKEGGGTIAGTDVIVFSPEQVKYVENWFPTNNPDIRYSIDPTTGYEEGSVQDRVLKLLKTSTPEDAAKVLKQWVADAEAGKVQVREDEKDLHKRLTARKPVTAQEAAQKRAELDALIKKYGSIPEGEKASRRVFMPKNAADDRAVSKYARTVAEAKQTPDWFVAEVERGVADQGAGFTHDIWTDKKAMAYVQSRKRYGFEANLRRWEEIIDSGRGTGTFGNISKDDIALGEFLYTEAVKAGDVATATRLVSQLALAGTQAGQVVQAMSLLKKMTPSGQLYYLQKAVERLNRADERNIAHGKHQEIVIDPDLAKAVLGAKTKEDLDAAMDALLQDIADQAPVTWAEKLNTWRYFAMLGNFRTHIRNIFSNVIFAPVTWMKDVVGAATEAAFIRDPNQRSKHLGQAFANVSYDFSLGRVRANEYTDFAAKDFADIRDVLLSGGKHNPSDEIRDRRKIFKSKAMQWANKANELNSNALTKEDALFSHRAYVSALSQYLAARKADVSKLNSTADGRKLLAAAREYAVLEAQKATFRDACAFASALSKFERTNAVTQLVVGGIMPFKKTPMNVLRRGVEYSPIGLVTSLTRDLYQLRNGDKNAADVVNSFAAGFTGTGLMALGFFLASKALLRAGGGDDEKERAFEELQGAQQYSFTVGNFSYTIDWMAPAALPLFIGCEMYNAFSENEDLTIADFADTLLLVAEPMFQMTMLDGLNRTLTTAGYSDNPLSAVAGSVIMGYFGQFIPTLAGQVARTMDGTRRTAYVDKNKGGVETFDRFFQTNVMQKLPGASQDLTPWLDAWGRTDTQSNVLLRAMENFLSPGYANVMKTSAMEDELQRLYDVTGNAGVLPQSAAKYFNVNKVRYDLSADEWVTYQTEMGQGAYEMLTRLVNSRAYSALSDAQKASAVEDVFTYAKEKARAEAVQGYATTASWIGKADALADKGLSVEDYIVQSVIGDETSGQNTLDVIQMSWLSDADKALLISAAYGKSLTGGSTFTDPNRSGYAYEMTDTQTSQYLNHFDKVWEEEYADLISKKRYQNSSDAEKAAMLDELKSECAADTKKWMARELRKAGIKSTKKS